MAWLFHCDPPASGAHNMAKDEFCLEQAARTGRPVLRLYRWERLTLSVGRAQKLERELRLEACRAAGIPLVRRITGGRAVLHGGDLTYAVAAPAHEPRFQGGIMAIYREISAVFVHFLRDLGLDPQVKCYSGRERGELASPVCFATPSAFEILVAGRKLVGSAQRLQARGFLQHGSIPLAPQADTLARVFRGADADGLRATMTDLATLRGAQPLPVAEVADRLARSFAAVMDTTLEPAPWGETEAARVRGLEAGYPYLEGGANPAAAAAPLRRET